MKKQVKKKQGILMLGVCLLIGTFCACNQGKETNITVTPAEVSITLFPSPEITATRLPENTKVPSMTAKPENSLTAGIRLTGAPVPTEGQLSSPTPEPEGELIPIDEEHFTSAVFRSYLANYYDRNQDGYLSYPERAAVTALSFGEYDNRDEFKEECLDGFEYFPHLTGLDVRCAEKVVLRNCLSLLNFGGEEGYIGTLIIEDCPALEKIYFFALGLDTLRITGASALELYRAHCATVNHITLDGNVALDIETEHHEAFIYIGPEIEDRLYFDTVEDYVQTVGVEWVNTGEKTAPLSAGEVKECLKDGEFGFFEFQISEMPEGSSDDNGKRGFFITADNKEPGCRPVVFPLYTERVPEEGDFFVRPSEIHEVKVLKYSPNRGNFARIHWSLEFIYRTEQGEAVLGQTERTHYIHTLPDGTVRVYSSLEEWEENGEWYPLKEGEIRINEEAFSSAVFRRYLNSKYNVGGGYEKLLSLREREAVKVMDFSGSVRFYGETLDGFEHFPCLSELYLGAVETLIVENHPSLKVIGGHSRGLKKVVIRNCPELERIELDLSAVEEVVVEGCEKLKLK